MFLMNGGLGVMTGALFWMNEIIFLSALPPYCTNHRKIVILRWIIIQHRDTKT